MAHGPTVTSGQLLDSGLLARPSAAATVQELLDLPPAGVGRVVLMRVMGGVDIEVWPDRGLDIGPAWYRGTPLSWTSPVGRGSPLPIPHGADWLSRFTGGLVTTCGTDHVGPATERAGMHGRHSHLPAVDVRTDRYRDGDETVCRVSGTVEDVSMFDRRVVVRRSVETRTDSPLVVLRDEVRNDGFRATQVPLLYHVNLGAPLVHPGTRLSGGGRETVPREPVPHVPEALLLPEPGDGSAEAVFEHDDVVVDDGWARLVVSSPVWDVVAEVSWSAESLPRLYEWVWPTRRGWALGVEPSNAGMYDRPGSPAGAPSLQPGATFATELRIALRHVSPSGTHTP